MFATFYSLLLYLLGNRTLRSSDFIIATLPRYLSYIFDSMSKINICLRRRGSKLSGYLWMIRSISRRFLFEDYTVHHGKLNLHHTISANSGSNDYILTMSGVKIDGPEEVASWSQLTSLI